MSTQDTLLKAADEIHSRGWHRGFFYGPAGNGGVCVLGALHCALTGNPMSAGQHGREYIAAARAVAEHLGFDTSHYSSDTGWLGRVTNWNDYVALDADEVVHALKGAAEDVAPGV